MLKSLFNKTIIYPIIFNTLIISLMALRPLVSIAAAHETMPHGRPANLVELSLVLVFAFYLFTKLGKPKPSAPPRPRLPLADQLLQEVELERLNHLSEGGTKLLKPRTRKGEIIVSIVKFDDRLYPEPPKNIAQKLLEWLGLRDNAHEKRR